MTLAKRPLKNCDIEARLEDTAGGDVFEALLAVAKKPVDGRRNWPPSRIAREVARLQAAHKAKRKRLMAAALDERLAKPRRKTDPGYGRRIQDRILRVMQPGQWHSAADIMAAADIGRNQRWVLWVTMRDRGLVVSRWDPELRDVCHGHKVPQRLFRLTRRGELERQALLLFDGGN